MLRRAADSPPLPLVIATPHAGRGRARRELWALAGLLRDALGEYDLACTAGPGHATRIAAAAVRQGRPLVVSVGGDGTLREVVNGLLGHQARQSNVGAAPPTGTQAISTADDAAHATGSSAGLALPRLGLVATGTGSDVGKGLGVRGRARECIAALAGNRDRLIDVGWAILTGTGGRRCRRLWINGLSGGLGGLVDLHAASAPAWLPDPWPLPRPPSGPSSSAGASRFAAAPAWPTEDWLSAPWMRMPSPSATERRSAPACASAPWPDPTTACPK